MVEELRNPEVVANLPNQGVKAEAYLNEISAAFENPGANTWRLLQILMCSTNQEIIEKLFVQRNIPIRQADLYRVYQPREFKICCPITFENIIRETGVLYCSKSGHYEYLATTETLREIGPNCPVSRAPIEWVLLLDDLEDEEFNLLLDEQGELRDFNRYQKEASDAFNNLLLALNHKSLSVKLLISRPRDLSFALKYSGSTPLENFLIRTFTSVSFPSLEEKAIHFLSEITSEILYEQVCNGRLSIMPVLLSVFKPELLNSLEKENLKLLLALSEKKLLRTLFRMEISRNASHFSLFFCCFSNPSGRKLLSSLFRKNPSCVSEIPPEEFAQYLGGFLMHGKFGQFSLLWALSRNRKIRLIPFLEKNRAILECIKPEEWSAIRAPQFSPADRSVFMGLVKESKNHPFLASLVNRHPIILHELVSRPEEREILTDLFIRQKQEFGGLAFQRRVREFFSLLPRPEEAPSVWQARFNQAILKLVPLRLLRQKALEFDALPLFELFNSSVWSFSHNGLSTNEILTRDNLAWEIFFESLRSFPDIVIAAMLFLLEQGFFWYPYLLIEVLATPYHFNLLTMPSLDPPMCFAKDLEPEMGFWTDSASSLFVSFFLLKGLVMAFGDERKEHIVQLLSYFAIAVVSLGERFLEKEHTGVGIVFTAALWLPIISQSLGFFKSKPEAESYLIDEDAEDAAVIPAPRR